MFWLHFTEAAGATNSPILAYHLTHQMLQNILSSFNQSAIQKSTTIESEIPEITADEKAGIEYIGGYIVRTLIRKISKKNPPKKKMLYLLFQLKEWDECFSPETSKEAKANLHIHSIVTEFVNLRGFAHVARWIHQQTENLQIKKFKE